MSYPFRKGPPAWVKPDMRRLEKKARNPNLESARIIFANFELYGVDSLMGVWARETIRKAEEAEREKAAPLLKGIA